VQFELRNKLSDIPQARVDPCAIRYSLVITGGSHINTFGVRQSGAAELEKLRSRYVEATKEALGKMRCATSYAEAPGGEADLRVRVQRLLSLSMLPQEWLTGLSLGVIPSWGTRPRQYTYTFENTRTKKTHIYYVDKTTYNHLVLLPALIFADPESQELDVYREALANFMESS